MSKKFYYKDRIPASKSIMNRLLVCKTFSPQLKIIGDSSCDDVRLMKQAVNTFAGNEFFCGSAGTVFRFLSCRLSRRKGEFLLKATERLLSRPQKDLLAVFEQLGVSYEIGPDFLKIISDGWQPKQDQIYVDRSKSSQFLSGLLLSAWDLEKDIEFYWGDSVVSDGYLQMSLELLKNLGMEFEIKKSSIKIFAKQKIRQEELAAEIDLSSCFAVAAIASVEGSAEFLDFPINSLQPDKAFVEILKAMNVDLNFTGDVLHIKANHQLKACKWSLNDCPDLFPVLAVLCSQAEGISELGGAPHLGFKESDRLGKTEELLNLMGKKFERIEGGLRIFGKPNTEKTSFSYDTDEDHRLAFAAGLAQTIGYDVKILHPEVVSKSFPEFWQVLEGKL